MKKFYLLRHEDVNGLSGTGVVAEGCLFDFGMGSLNWLTDEPTVTVFTRGYRGIRKLHGHNDKTEIVVECDSKHKKRYEKYKMCVEMAAAKKTLYKSKVKVEEEADD
jgi:hypothetical protein